MKTKLANAFEIRRAIRNASIKVNNLRSLGFTKSAEKAQNELQLIMGAARKYGVSETDLEEWMR